MTNRRIFIKSGIYVGIGLLTIPFMDCKKSEGDGDDNSGSQPQHPAITPDPGIDLYGSIIDTDSKPVAGVVVSDGFQCVVTDEKGIYRMKKDAQAKYVFYSTPAEYEVSPLNKTVNSATFYTPLDNNSKRYNFTLTKLPAAETEFTLLCIGDPQVAAEADVTRYQNETLPDLKAFVDGSAKPCYGLVMGDMTGDHPEFFTRMRALTGSTDMPFFATIGNHDKTGGNASTPRNADAFCAVYGPLDYSFNRGNVHFVCLDDVVYANNTNYSAGLEDRQIEWLRQDLSHVAKDKLIIIYYHIPIRNSASFKNREAFFNVLKDFGKVHLMCGHTHYNENFMITSPMTVYEHIHAAACGAWWKSTVNCDGSPNGYAVYDVKGTELTNWYYKPTKYNRDFQIRLHLGDTKFGGQYGEFSYNQSGKIVANIWNVDSGWVIEAYEDGVKAGNLTKLGTLIDAFAAGYHVGVLNRIPANYGATGSGSNKHAYVHTLKNQDAKVIEIRATDRFGTVYKQSELIHNLTTAEAYPN
ncbi:MAG: calcineurin-like phosphoesterase family protein [Bacteroidales bacterium]|jgi:hypothetical protein|nr:calcineurin-like phosphoesterase family protein [Bacteroidales bacterium]